MAVITLHLDEQILNQCKTLAKKQKITLNEFIVKALKEFINEQEAKKCQTDSTLNKKF